jgi:hypothetical protein
MMCGYSLPHYVCEKGRTRTGPDFCRSPSGPGTKLVNLCSLMMMSLIIDVGNNDDKLFMSLQCSYREAEHVQARCPKQIAFLPALM